LIYKLLSFLLNLREIKYVFNIMNTNAYIKNVGSTQTIIKDNHSEPIFSDVLWQATYDGKKANVNITTNTNGQTTNYSTKLDNNDLARLLDIPSVRGDISERLLSDFPIEDSEKVMDIVSFPSDISFPSDKYTSQLLYQPLLQPLSAKKKRVITHKKHKKQKSKQKKSELVGRTAALKYKTPLPQTMRIHLTSASNSSKKKTIKHRKKSRDHNFFTDLFQK
jgi:hypothetical protein